MKQVGKGLKAIRTKMGLTQQDVSVLSQIDLEDVKMLEESKANSPTTFKPFEKTAMHTYIKGIKVPKTTLMTFLLEDSDIKQNLQVYKKLNPSIMKLQKDILKDVGKKLKKKATRLIQKLKNKKKK